METGRETGKKRTVFEIVTEDGVMRPREICRIIRALCDRLDQAEDAARSRMRMNLCPQSVLVGADGGIALSEDAVPVSLREAYIPPEQSRDCAPAGSAVYSLGMLMLFMSTGSTDKSGLDSFYPDKQLKRIIENCTFLDPGLRFQSEAALAKELRYARRIQKKLLAGLFLFLLLTAVAALAFALFLSGRDKGRAAGKGPGYSAGYAAGYEQGYSDAHGIGIGPVPYDEANGNLPGNIINGAFCSRSAKELYFISAGSLYRMELYTGDTELLAEGAGAQCVCYYDGWVYYSTDRAVMRLDPATRKSETVCAAKTGLLHIADGTIYLDSSSAGGYLYRLESNSGELKQLNDRTEYDCLNIAGSQLYYIEPNQGRTLFHSDLDGGNKELLSSYRFESICLCGESIYGYAGDSAQTGRLIRMNIHGGGIQPYTDTRISCLNATEGGLFFVSGENHALEWMSLSGDARFTILPSDVGNFNVADRWILYQNEADGGRLWCVRVDGTGGKKLP